MGETFEITFFLKRDCSENDIKKFTTIFQVHFGYNIAAENHFKFLNEKNLYFQVFYEENYTEIQLSVENLTFTAENFNEKLHHLLELVHTCFSYVSSIQIATGIYELTYYYLENCIAISDILSIALSRFPFVFLQKDVDTSNFNQFLGKKYGSIQYIFQQGTKIQNIF